MVLVTKNAIDGTSVINVIRGEEVFGLIDYIKSNISDNSSWTLTKEYYNSKLACLGK